MQKAILGWVKEISDHYTLAIRFPCGFLYQPCKKKTEQAFESLPSTQKGSGKPI